MFSVGIGMLVPFDFTSSKYFKVNIQGLPPIKSK